MRKRLPVLSILSILLMAATASAIGLPLLPASALAACPIPPIKVSPDVSVKIEHDRTTGIYSYSYTVANRREAPLAIDSFFFQIDERPLAMPGPEKWGEASFHKPDETEPSVVTWGTITRDIHRKPSQ